jgi:hypothetical protein
MLNNTLQLKVKQRVNKLSSQDYDNIECWQIVEAFNKGMITWCREKIAPKTATPGNDQSVRSIDDLQVLVKTEKLLTVNRGNYYESELLPEDFMEYKRVTLISSNSCCDKPKKMITYLVEESNIDIILNDELKKPNYEWGETVVTVVDNKLRIYTNGEFSIDECTLTYYRLPEKIQILDCVNPYTFNTSTVDIECEFKEDITELLIDICAQIISGDIESTNQYQRLNQKIEENK